MRLFLIVFAAVLAALCLFFHPLLGLGVLGAGFAVWLAIAIVVGLIFWALIGLASLPEAITLGTFLAFRALLLFIAPHVFLQYVLCLTFVNVVLIFLAVMELTLTSPKCISQWDWRNTLWAVIVPHLLLYLDYIFWLAFEPYPLSDPTMHALFVQFEWAMLTYVGTILIAQTIMLIKNPPNRSEFGEIITAALPIIFGIIVFLGLLACAHVYPTTLIHFMTTGKAQ